jgi:hypothetical protein
VLALTRIPEDRWMTISAMIPALLAQDLAPARECCVIIVLGISPELRYPGSSSCSSVTTGSQQTMEGQIRSSLSDHHDGRVQDSANFVGGVDHSFHSHHSPIHGRFPEGLGCPCERDSDFRPVVYGRGNVTHQSVRNEACVIGSQTVFPVVVQPTHSTIHGQLFSGCLHQQRGREPFSHPVPDSGRTPHFRERDRLVGQSKAHSGRQECSSGSAFTLGADCLDRVDAQPACSEPVIQAVGSTSPRSICNKIHNQTTSICVTIPRRESRYYCLAETTQLVLYADTGPQYLPR